MRLLIDSQKRILYYEKEGRIPFPPARQAGKILTIHLHGGRDHMRTKQIGTFFFLTAVFSALALLGSALPSDAATKCTLNFTLSGWAAFYETASGNGTIMCDNGQSAKVTIRAKGGGLTAGKYRRQGHGSFSEVSGIREVFGSYARAEAHAGAAKSATAQVMTKGSVSLAITATGSGFDLGIGFGKFVIRPAGKATTK